jgi:hypothetical protein
MVIYITIKCLRNSVFLFPVLLPFDHRAILQTVLVLAKELLPVTPTLGVLLGQRPAYVGVADPLAVVQQLPALRFKGDKLI